MPTIAQLFDEVFCEFAKEENSEAAAEPKRPPSADLSQSSLGSRSSGVKTRSVTKTEREESQPSVVFESPKKRKPFCPCTFVSFNWNGF